MGFILCMAEGHGLGGELCFRRRHRILPRSKRNYAPTIYTSRLTFAQSIVYDLPFGSGKMFLRDGWLGKAVGGWKVAGIVHVQTGEPMTFLANANQLNAPGTSQLANQVKPFKKLYGIGTGNPWFDTTAFTQPNGTVLGNSGVNVFSGPGLFTFDSSLFRTFRIRNLWLWSCARMRSMPSITRCLPIRQQALPAPAMATSLVWRVPESMERLALLVKSSLPQPSTFRPCTLVVIPSTGVSF